MLNSCGVFLKAVVSQQGGAASAADLFAGKGPGAAGGGLWSQCQQVCLLVSAHLAPNGKPEGQVPSRAASLAPASPAALPGALDM